MAPRYFIEQRIRTEEVQLSGAEAHHMANVMRCRIGDRIVLFDGSGKEYQAEVIDLDRHGVCLSIKSSAECDRELAGELIVASAMPKGDRQRFLIEKLVELGVTTLIPLSASRSVAQCSAATINRLKRNIVEASKQCGRNRLMHIGNTADCTTYFASETCSTKFVAHPTGAPINTATWTPAIAVAIGPEGGFTTEELSSAVEHHWQPISSGTRILRIETAAIFMAALAAARLS